MSHTYVLQVDESEHGWSVVGYMRVDGSTHLTFPGLSVYLNAERAQEEVTKYITWLNAEIIKSSQDTQDAKPD